jgi:hypothetical protein
MNQKLEIVIQRAASQIISGLGTAIPRQAVLQLVFKDTRNSAFIVTTGGEGFALHDGRHKSPDISMFLTEADLLDLTDHGHIRNYVVVTGPVELILAFRNRFMSISHEGKVALEGRVAKSIRLRAVSRVSLNSLSSNEFIEHFAVGSVPVVITEAMPRARASSWTVEKLVNAYGKLQVQIRSGDYAKKIYQKDMEVELASLGDYIRYCRGAAGLNQHGARPPPYAANNIVPPEWHAWLDYPPFIPKVFFAFTKFWIGPGGSITPLHRDWSDNFLTQIIGTKNLVLFSPDHNAIFQSEEVHLGLDSCRHLDPTDATSQVIQQSVPLAVELNAGEMLFLPAGWFHDVRTPEFSFSINFFSTRIPYAAFPPC